MKKTYSIVVAVTLLLFFFGTYQFTNIGRSPKYTPWENMYPNENLKRPTYHFVMVCQSIDEPYFEAVKKGALRAAGELNVAIEFYGPQFTNVDEELQYMDMAIASKVDGIVTDVPNENKFAKIINKASNAGIPVVTIVSDAENSDRICFVGDDIKKLGQEWSKLILEATDGEGLVAIIVDGSNDVSNNSGINLAISQIKNSIKQFPKLDIKTFETSKMDMFNAEQITDNLLNTYDKLKLILCTSERYTIGAAQVLVDFNKVGKVGIIGYGDLPEILKYIQKGVVYGTVASTQEKIGYESIKVLFEKKSKKVTPAYIYSDLHTIRMK